MYAAWCIHKRHFAVEFYYSSIKPRKTCLGIFQIMDISHAFKQEKYLGLNSEISLHEK